MKQILEDRLPNLTEYLIAENCESSKSAKNVPLGSLSSNICFILYLLLILHM
jgi:hypothetical protein